MFLPGSIRISPAPSSTPNSQSLLVELVGDDGSVFETSGDIKLPLSKPVTYGRVFAEVELKSKFGGFAISAPAKVPAGGKNPEGDVMLTTEKAEGAAPKK